MHTKNIILLLLLVAAWQKDPAQMVALSRAKLPQDIQDKLRVLDKAEAQSVRARRLSKTQSATLFAAEPDLQQQRREIADSLLGLGYDLWSGSMFTQCIEPDAVVLRPLPPSGHNNHNVYSIRQIENVSQFEENRSSGVNASVTYKLISFGGGVSESSGHAFKSTSKYLDAYIRYVGDEYAMSGGSPTGAAVARLQSSNEDFAKVCGQQFISRVGFGVTLDGRMSAEISIDEKSQQNKADVSVGFSNLFGLGADSSTTVKTMSSKAALSTKLAGPSGIQPKPEDFVETVRQFGANNPAAYSTEEVYVETTPYSQVAYRIFRDFDDVAMQATGSVLALESDRLVILQQRDDLEDAIAHPEFMKVTAPSGTSTNEQLLKQQNDYLDALGSVWKTCRAAIDQAGIDSCKQKASATGPRPPKLSIELQKQAAPPH